MTLIRFYNPRCLLKLSTQVMPRRSLSESSPFRVAKRAKLDDERLTLDDFKDGVFLAPMVRSGARITVPTRLFALKHGATLVWGPEIVDKAILHSTREVDPVTGVISYNGISRAIFSTHPVEKPYLIYQIGSSDPDLAVQAAKTVMQDVSGIDLNCGCPKPFSTHAGMGAALLTNPNVLCSILTALRKEMPPHITVTAKIRLLPSQEDTLNLVERIVNTGVSALTVHCRTKNMREKDRAVIERLREIVDFVRSMGKGIAVVENGDCKNWEDAKRVREITGADSVMIARGAESNPSCFSLNPLVDVEKNLIPSYLRLSQYIRNHFSLTKFCVNQFKGARVEVTKSDSQTFHQLLSKAKDYASLKEIMGPDSGEQDFQDLVKAIEENSPRQHRMIMDSGSAMSAGTEDFEGIILSTPEDTQNPEPPGSGAPLLPNDFEKIAIIPPGHDSTTPTPNPATRTPVLI